jgi:glucokinase
MQELLGIDIGGTKCAVLFGMAGENSIRVIDKIRFETSDPATTQKAIFDSLDRIIRRNRLAQKSIAGVGISCGGPLNSALGLVLSPPNLPGWDHVPIVDMVQKQTGLPARLQNDANACALAEWKYGAGRGCDNVIFLTFGTGMGAGLIFDGRLYSGKDDLAGETGHIRLADTGPVGFGKAGSFEGFCSGGGIARMAEEKLNRIMTAKEVAEAAGAGDPAALEILETSGRRLGEGLSILIDLLNPDIIILGGIYMRCERFLKPPALAVIEKETLPAARRRCRIEAAGLGESIGDYAALVMASELVAADRI